MDLLKLMKALDLLCDEVKRDGVEFESKSLGDEAKPKHAKLFSFLAEQVKLGLWKCQVEIDVYPVENANFEMKINATIGLDKAQKQALQALYESNGI